MTRIFTRKWGCIWNIKGEEIWNPFDYIAPESPYSETRNNRYKRTNKTSAIEIPQNTLNIVLIGLLMSGNNGIYCGIELYSKFKHQNAKARLNPSVYSGYIQDYHKTWMCRLISEKDSFHYFEWSSYTLLRPALNK